VSGARVRSLIQNFRKAPISAVAIVISRARPRRYSDYRWTLQECDQELKGLVLEFQASAVSAQLPGAHVNFEAIETVAFDCFVAAVG
jgi:hypothetical protein